MLIWRVDDWRVESDGYVCGKDLSQLEDLLALRRANLRFDADKTARLAQRARAVKRRALAHGYHAGRAIAVHDLVMPASATAFALSCLKERLVHIVMQAVQNVVGELPASAIVPNQLRRCLTAVPRQHLLSVRVAACDYDEAKQAIDAIQNELDFPLVTLLADADLPPRSCVVETDTGVIDGSLRHHLASLESGIRDAIGALLDEYTRLDPRIVERLNVVEHELRDTLEMLSSVPAFGHAIPLGATTGGLAR